MTKIFVGLGNPGDRYARNRHNVGFMVLDALARELSGQWAGCLHFRSCPARIEGAALLLVEPLTYMNNSGKVVYPLVAQLRKNPEDLVVICDDLNLPLGRIRIRERGSAGGHRGLESILEAFNTEEILRIRMGIGQQQMPENKAEFVLTDFPPENKMELDEMIRTAGNAAQSILRVGASKTMAIFNA